MKCTGKIFRWNKGKGKHNERKIGLERLSPGRD